MPRKPRKAAAKTDYARNLGNLFPKTPTRRPPMPTFDSGRYDVKALFAAAARGEIEIPGGMPHETEEARREANEWLRGPGYKAWLRGE